MHLAQTSLLCLAALGVVVGCGPSAPPGRTANQGIRREASSLLHMKVTAVEFRFQIDDHKVLVGTYVETDPMKIKEVILALLASSRDQTSQIEPGMEDAVMDSFGFVVEGKNTETKFRMHRLDLDRRWGPEVKQIHARYRAMAKTEE